MKIALYIGNHANDTLVTRAGWALTRVAQKGQFANVTHVEAIHAEAADGSVTIASASIREGSLKTGAKNGVRTKSGVFLTPEHWRIAYVPTWNVERSIEWFAQHDGEPYDLRGAFASAWPLEWRQDNHWFCNQAVGDAFLNSAHIFGPSLFASVITSWGYEVTHHFFGARAQ